MRTRLFTLIFLLLLLRPAGAENACADAFGTKTLSLVTSPVPVDEGTWSKNLSDTFSDAFILGAGGYGTVVRFRPKDGSQTFTRKFYDRMNDRSVSRKMLQQDLIALSLLRYAIGKMDSSDQSLLRVPGVKSFDLDRLFVDMDDVRGTDLSKPDATSLFDSNTLLKIHGLFSRLLSVWQTLGNDEIDRIVEASGLNWRKGGPPGSYVSSDGFAFFPKTYVIFYKWNNIVMEPSGRLVIVDPH